MTKTVERISLNAIREKFLSFFESKGHMRLNSFSLIPQNDPSLLLINSGMAPMKKYFTGELTPPSRRVVTCQRCIRTPDLDRVGHTARHGTYFEMLGNFSFGDYFKTEAIHWAWEFLTETLGIPAERLWPSVYEKDSEAFDIWANEIGIPKEKIVRLGREDNFWEHGSGPCGPCSEIYFDRGEKYGCGKPDCKPGCDCDRYMEIWNNVFSQFENDGQGNYSELRQKNIDTGMGLERLACVVQGADNLFEVDTVRGILDTVCEISGKKYGDGEKSDISIRVITDHLRAAVFMISDGILPSNEGRGYVLRRLLRRAARHGKLLNIGRPFLKEICGAVIRANGAAYPELNEKRNIIEKIIATEESNFAKTIDQGLKMLDEMTAGRGSTLSGDDAFRLYDTYGFPLDITKEILAEKGMAVDEKAFEERMFRQREMARNARKQSDTDAWKRGGALPADIPATVFTGYTETESEGTIAAVIKDGVETETAGAGDKVTVILDKTPFYAESGGQAADTGTVSGKNVKLSVYDTQKNAAGVFAHSCVIESGILSKGDRVTASVDVARRDAIRRNHTAAHLLQGALRQILGTHVEQAGQSVTEHSVRFDFTHFSALTREELETVEAKVNEAILAAAPVETREMPLADAKALGAMALFGEKYGNTVRVVSVPGYSVELCGGTHIDNTAKIGLFQIVSESSAAAGVRRIEAVTGTGVLRLLETQKEEISAALTALKIDNPATIGARAEQIVEELRKKDRIIERLNRELADRQFGDIASSAEKVNGFTLITATVNNMPAETLRGICDKLKDKFSDVVAVIANTGGSSVNFAAACGKDAVKRGAHAGKLVAAVAAVTGGRGGGRPDFAMAGAKDATKTADALLYAKTFIAEIR